MPVTKYLWDEDTDTVVLEQDGAGNTQAVYTQEPYQYGRLLSQHRDGVTSHFHFDGNGNTRALTDENENVTDTYTYTAFGDQVATTGTTKNRYRFGGQYGYQYNEPTQDYYVRERVYEPTRGRWTSQDPLPFVDGAYRYAKNVPTSFVDSSGWFGINREQVSVRAGSPDSRLHGGKGRYGFWATTWPGAHGNPETLGELIETAETLSRKVQTCIREIAIAGHGGPWGFDIKKDGRWSWQTDQHLRRVFRLLPPSAYHHEVIDIHNARRVRSALDNLPFCCPCIIYLGGCNAGLAAWPKQIADATGCTVIATGGASSGSYLTGRKNVYADALVFDYRLIPTTERVVGCVGFG